MRITTKGQVTIPVHIREKFGFLPNTDVEFVVEGKTVFLRKIETSKRRGSRLIDGMRGRATTKMTTDEILALTRG